MPQTPHIERHFTAGAVVRDVVIGMSDGLTVPFALAAGLSGAVDNSHIVVVAGLGGYLAARSDAEHYESERLREEREVKEIPDEEALEVQKVFADYGLSHDESVPVVQALTRKPKQWVDFMMRFELGLEAPDPKRAVQSAFTIAASYICGGIIPLAPYMTLHSARMALVWSVVVTLLALGIFGYIKGRFTGSRPGRSATQTIVIGGLAAGAAFLLARLIS